MAILRCDKAAPPVDKQGEKLLGFLAPEGDGLAADENIKIPESPDRNGHPVISAFCRRAGELIHIVKQHIARGSFRRLGRADGLDTPLLFRSEIIVL